MNILYCCELSSGLEQEVLELEWTQLPFSHRIQGILVSQPRVVEHLGTGIRLTVTEILPLMC